MLTESGLRGRTASSTSAPARVPPPEVTSARHSPVHCCARVGADISGALKLASPLSPVVCVK